MTIQHCEPAPRSLFVLRVDFCGLHVTDPDHVPELIGLRRADTAALPALGRFDRPQLGGACIVILANWPDPELGLRSCRGILRLSKSIAPERAKIVALPPSRPVRPPTVIFATTAKDISILPELIVYRLLVVAWRALTSLAWEDPRASPMQSRWTVVDGHRCIVAFHRRPACAGE